MDASGRGADFSSASVRLSYLAITLNPCIDKTYTIQGFQLNQVHRTDNPLVTAGGKGINVARVLKKLGGDVTATGFLGGMNGDWLQRSLENEKISSDFIRVREESRLCIALIDPENHTQTEINELGPPITSEDETALISKLRELLPTCKVVIISGSMPPAASENLYRKIIELAQTEYSLKVFFDASGDALLRGAAAQPYLIKPNIHEASVFGVDPRAWEQGAEKIRRQCNIPAALLTNGAAGAVVATERGAWAARPPSMPSSCAIGSGDCLLAAFIWAMINGYNDHEALRLGVAAGAANAASAGAGVYSQELARAIYNDVVIRQLS